MAGDAGYLGIGPEEGIFVPEAEAFTYALGAVPDRNRGRSEGVPGNAD